MNIAKYIASKETTVVNTNKTLSRLNHNRTNKKLHTKNMVCTTNDCSDQIQFVNLTEKESLGFWIIVSIIGFFGVTFGVTCFFTGFLAGDILISG
jgi:hypothetical protein